MDTKNKPGCPCCDQCYGIPIEDVPDVEIPGWIAYEGPYYSPDKCCYRWCFHPEESTYQNGTQVECAAEPFGWLEWQENTNIGLIATKDKKYFPICDYFDERTVLSKDECCSSRSIYATEELSKTRRASWRLLGYSAPAQICVSLSRQYFGNQQGCDIQNALKYVVRMRVTYSLWFYARQFDISHRTKTSTIINPCVFYNPNKCDAFCNYDCTRTQGINDCSDLDPNTWDHEVPPWGIDVDRIFRVFYPLHGHQEFVEYYDTMPSGGKTLHLEGAGDIACRNECPAGHFVASEPSFFIDSSNVMFCADYWPYSILNQYGCLLNATFETEICDKQSYKDNPYSIYYWEFICDLYSGSPDQSGTCNHECDEFIRYGLCCTDPTTTFDRGCIVNNAPTQGVDQYYYHYCDYENFVHRGHNQHLNFIQGDLVNFLSDSCWWSSDVNNPCNPIGGNYPRNPCYLSTHCDFQSEDCDPECCWAEQCCPSGFGPEYICYPKYFFGGGFGLVNPASDTTLLSYSATYSSELTNANGDACITFNFPNTMGLIFS